MRGAFRNVFLYQLAEFSLHFGLYRKRFLSRWRRCWSVRWFLPYLDMVCLIPKPNDISSWVNNCLGFFLATSCFVACVKRTDPPCSFQRSELSRCIFRQKLAAGGGLVRHHHRDGHRSWLARFLWTAQGSPNFRLFCYSGDLLSAQAILAPYRSTPFVASLVARR